MAEQRFSASFRGVPFLVTEASDTAGQHTIVHEFPSRKPVVDHNGPLPQRFRLDCVLIGANYQTDLVNLEEAFNTPGPGTLIHHWRGSFLASVDGEYTVTRSTRQGGMASLSVTFIVAGDEEAPTVSVETFDLVITEGEIALAAMADMVEEGFDVAGNNSTRERSTTILQDIVTAVADANNAVQSTFGSVNSTSADITRFNANVESLVNSPHTMATTISRSIDAVFQSITNVVDSVGEIDPLGDLNQILGAILRGRQVLVAMGIFRDGNNFGSGYSTPGDSTPQQRQRAANQRLLIQAARISFVVGVTAAITRIGVEHSRQASRVFQDIADAIADLRGDVDDQTYRALINLRAAFGAHLRSSTSRLPEAVDYTPPNTVPALLLAHTLYGDATREAEIVERNSVLHPGFIPGNIAIEVLSA